MAELEQKNENMDGYTLDDAKNDKISRDNLAESNIKNVLLLNMSTLKDGKQTESKYIFDDLVDEKNPIKGYGQLEPVPQLLNDYILKDKNEELDLIIITASDEASGNGKKKNNDGKVKTGEADISWVEKTPQNEEKVLKERTNAVDFFKYRIRKRYGRHVQFYTVDIEDVNHALNETTDVIRIIKKNNEDFQLYVDIHGGLRDIQLLFDAIISTLSAEDIQVKEAYSCEYASQGEPSILKSVTDQLQIFRLVSGIKEFVRYGSGQELQEYIENTGKRSSDENQNKTWRETLAENIQEVSDALALCQVTKFEKALGKLNKTIVDYEDKKQKKKQDGFKRDELFEIFIGNIKDDYGSLLERGGRTLHAEVKWALRKHFYQQCLAIIEAKTAEFVFGKLVYENSLRVERLEELKERKRKRGRESWEWMEEMDTNTLNVSTNQLDRKYDRDFKKVLGTEKIQMDTTKDLYLKTMFYKFDKTDYIKNTENNGIRLIDNFNEENREMLFVYYGRSKTYSIRCDNQNNRSSSNSNGNHSGNSNSNDDGAQYDYKYRCRYYLFFKKRNDFDENTFRKFGKAWWYLKNNIRNKMFHVDDGNTTSVKELEEKINDYLENLQKLMNDLSTRQGGGTARQEGGSTRQGGGLARQERENLTTNIGAVMNNAISLETEKNEEKRYDAEVVKISGKGNAWVKIIDEGYHRRCEKPAMEGCDGYIVNRGRGVEVGTVLKVIYVNSNPNGDIFEKC